MKSLLFIALCLLPFAAFGADCNPSDSTLNTVITVTSACSSRPRSETINGDATSAGVTVTLIKCNETTWGVIQNFKKLDSSGHAYTIAAASGQTIDGSSTFVLSTQGAAASLICNDTNAWQTLHGTAGNVGSGTFGTSVGGTGASTSSPYTVFGNPNNTTGSPSFFNMTSVNAQSGAGYTITTGDYGKLVTVSNASAQNLTLPATVPASGWIVFTSNTGAGTWTLKRNGHNIDGSTTEPTIATNSGMVVWSDGSNYFTMRGGSGSSSGHIIQDEGSDLAAEARLNFVGSMVTCADNAGVSTICTFTNPTISIAVGTTALTSGNTNAVIYENSGHVVSETTVNSTATKKYLEQHSSGVPTMTQVDYADLAGTPPTASGSAGGDLSGTYPNPTVAKINGATLGTTTATDKNILIADGSSWVSKAVSGDFTITNTGVATIANNAVTGAKLDVCTSTHAQGDIAYYDGTDWQCLPSNTGYLFASGSGANPTWTQINVVPSSFDGAVVTKSGSQTGVATATATAVSFQVETTDTGGYHDNVTNNSRFTVGTTGYYLIGCSINIAGAAPNNAGRRGVILEKNGGGTGSYLSTYQQATGGASGPEIQTYALASLTAADYVECKGYQDSGANGTISVATTVYWIVRIPIFHGVKAKLISNQSISNNSTTAVNFDGEAFDTDAYHDNTTNNSRFTVPSAALAGYYLIGCEVDSAANGTGKRSAIIEKNGVGTGGRLSYSDVKPNGSDSASVVTVTLTNLGNGDYVECKNYQDSGGNLNALSTSNGEAPTQFWMYRISTMVGAKSGKSGTQSTTSGVDATLTFDVDQFNTNTLHSTSSNTSRMLIGTSQLTGEYLVGCTGQWVASTNASSARIVRLEKNGGGVIISNNVVNAFNATSDTSTALTILPINGVANDYVECIGQQTTGGTLNVASTADGEASTQVWIYRIDGSN